MRRSHRLLAIAALLVLAVGLCVHYGATYDEAWPHPTGDQLAEEPDGWDGERVLLFGEVQAVGDGEFTMDVEDDAGEVVRTVTVRGAGPDVEPGGVVQVYGTLSESGTIQDAESVVVVNQSPGDSLYKWGVSVLGILLAAGAFLWCWRIDLRGVRFERRGGGGADGGGANGGGADGADGGSADGAERADATIGDEDGAIGGDGGVTGGDSGATGGERGG